MAHDDVRWGDAGGLAVTLDTGSAAQTRSFVLRPDGRHLIRVGRAAANDFVVVDRGVSSFHAELRLSSFDDGAACMRVYDQSTNGTGLQKRRGKPARVLAKSSGDVLPDGGTLVMPARLKHDDSKRHYIRVHLASLPPRGASNTSDMKAEASHALPKGGTADPGFDLATHGVASKLRLSHGLGAKASSRARYAPVKMAPPPHEIAADSGIAPCLGVAAERENQRGMIADDMDADVVTAVEAECFTAPEEQDSQTGGIYQEACTPPLGFANVNACDGSAREHADRNRSSSEDLKRAEGMAPAATVPSVGPSQLHVQNGAHDQDQQSRRSRSARLRGTCRMSSRSSSPKHSRSRGQDRNRSCNHSRNRNRGPGRTQFCSKSCDRGGYRSDVRLGRSGNSRSRQPRRRRPSPEQRAIDNGIRGDDSRSPYRSRRAGRGTRRL